MAWSLVGRIGARGCQRAELAGVFGGHWRRGESELRVVSTVGEQVVASGGKGGEAATSSAGARPRGGRNWVLLEQKVPNALRPSVWFHLSGGYELQQRSKNSYEQFWRSQNDPAVCALIERVLS